MILYKQRNALHIVDIFKVIMVASRSENDNEESQRASEFRKRFVESSGRDFMHLIADFRKLSKKEQKHFSEEKEKISEFIKLGLGDFPDDMDVESISSDIHEYRMFLKRLDVEIKLAETYLSHHEEIPDKIKDLLWRFYHIGSPEMLDMLASD
jgi:uncharacterized protein (UPF0305 family)